MNSFRHIMARGAIRNIKITSSGISLSKTLMPIQSRTMSSNDGLGGPPKMSDDWTDEDTPYHDCGYGTPFSNYNNENRWWGLFKWFLFLASGFWYPFFVYDYHRMRLVMG